MAPDPEQAAHVQLTPYRPEDAAALASFVTRLHPDRPRSAASVRRTDADRGSEYHARRLVWQGATLIGMAETERGRSLNQPGWYGLHVHSEGEELRARLLAWGLDDLRPLSPAVLHTTVGEHWPEHRWLLERGWREHERMWRSTLDLGTFDPASFAHRLERAAASGLRVVTLAEAGYDDSPASRRRYYALMIALLADVPSAEPTVPWPFELWEERVLGKPEFSPDGPLIAVSGGEWVGVTELYVPDGVNAGGVIQGLTGVRRGWRGLGAAWALKLTAATRARAQGFQAARTQNHVVNCEMLGINEAMGFVRGPAQVTLVRGWDEISPASAPASAG